MSVNGKQPSNARRGEQETGTRPQLPKNFSNISVGYNQICSQQFRHFSQTPIIPSSNSGPLHFNFTRVERGDLLKPIKFSQLSRHRGFCHLDILAVVTWFHYLNMYTCPKCLRGVCRFFTSFFQIIKTRRRTETVHYKSAKVTECGEQVDNKTTKIRKPKETILAFLPY